MNRMIIYIYIYIYIYTKRLLLLITEHKNHCVADSMSNFWDAFGPSKKLSMTSQRWYSIIQEKLQESIPSPSLSLPHSPRLPFHFTHLAHAHTNLEVIRKPNQERSRSCIFFKSINILISTLHVNKKENVTYYTVFHHFYFTGLI
jgi:hypothetical protein